MFCRTTKSTAFYSDEHRATINELFATIENNPIPMAVVDYLGRLQMDGEGDLKYVKHDTPDRFGVRDMRHVKAYNLTVVQQNEPKFIPGR